MSSDLNNERVGLFFIELGNVRCFFYMYLRPTTRFVIFGQAHLWPGPLFRADAFTQDFSRDAIIGPMRQRIEPENHKFEHVVYENGPAQSKMGL